MPVISKGKLTQMKRRSYIMLTTILIFIALIRVVWTYRARPQGIDEPAHVAAAIELVNLYTYTLDPVNVPLARYAIWVPLYLAGKRYPHLTPQEAAHPNCFAIGNHILYDYGHYVRNLILARCAMLPFSALASVLVFLWTRREFGSLAAFFAVLFFTTTPTVLAFSHWLGRSSMRSTLLFGIAIGFALMSKLTSSAG
jgi:hypothetical protein